LLPSTAQAPQHTVQLCTLTPAPVVARNEHRVDCRQQTREV